MKKQIYFTMTPYEEKALRENITNICQCDKIGYYKNSAEYTCIENNVEVTKFFLKPTTINAAPRYEVNEQGEYIIYPFDDDANMFPFIEYCAIRSIDTNEMHVRFYVNTLGIKKEFHPSLKQEFKTISKWLRSNYNEVSF